MKWCTFLTPVFILLMALPFTAVARALAVVRDDGRLRVPRSCRSFINIHRELFMPFVAGANDNASGVAAMLGVMERLVPAPDATSLVTTGSFPQIRRGPVAAEEADVVPEGSLLRYTPAGGRGDRRAARRLRVGGRVAPRSAAPRAGRARLRHDRVRRCRRATPSRDPRRDSVERAGTLPADAARRRRPPQRRERARSKRACSASSAARRSAREDEDVKGWLGVDEDFDARKAGRDIGSWDNFDERRRRRRRLRLEGRLGRRRSDRRS